MLRHLVKHSQAATVTNLQSFATAASTGLLTGDMRLPALVFLGPPGVGKGTYATRISEWLNIPHVAAGDLVREEMKSGSELGIRMKETVNKGNLLPDEVVLKLLQKRIQHAADSGDAGVLLDGFPRTVSQAPRVLDIVDVNLALNMQLREDVLLAKCLGRRNCSKCGKNWNIADINVPESADGKLPAIVMPPLNPPPECMHYLETRADDTEGVVLHRLNVYKAEAAPVEQFFRDHGLLMEFQITAGIPETLPRLKSLLGPYAARLQGLAEEQQAAHAA